MMHARPAPAFASLLLALGAGALLAAALPAAAAPQSDFNGDGADDLAVGIPRHRVQSQVGAGAVLVIYGDPGAGLDVAGNQLWSQASSGIGDNPEPNDEFGSAVATGDFNGDGFADLAIAAMFEDVGGVANAGAVHVIYGTANRLQSAHSRVLTQNTSNILNAVEVDDRFGRALAVGDFDGNGIDDLAIGVPYEDIGDIFDAGAVHVLYGSSSRRLRSVGSQIFNQNSGGVLDMCELGDRFGGDLVAGDFDGDGFDDLAIGVPFEDLGALVDAGAVHVLYGSAAKLRSSGDQLWTQDSPGVNDLSEAGDMFGRGVATGDFNNDGRADLAIGAFMEDVGAVSNAGAVNVLYGAATGLGSAGDQFWSQQSSGILEVAEQNDLFAAALCAGDFNGDGRDDLAIGVRNEEAGAHDAAGVVQIILGSGTGLRAAGNQLFSQATAGVLGAPLPGERFGSNLQAGDFDGDGRDDLAIGVPFEDVDGDLDAGAVHVLYGRASGLTAAGDQLFDQTTPGLKGSLGIDHQFGALACGGNPRQYGASLFERPQPWIAVIAGALALGFIGMQVLGFRRFTIPGAMGKC